MKNTGIFSIIISIFIFVGCASLTKQAALDKEPPAVEVAVEQPEKATIYFDKATRKWSLNKINSKQPRYEGEIAEGIPSGIGKLYLPNGFYEGKVKNGKFNGKGKRLYFEKGKLVGEFKDNKAHGQGIYTYLDGAKYVGGYKSGKKHGTGTLTYPDGDEYKGEWKKSMFHGHGSYIFKDGRKYVGYWKKDKKNGQGTFTWTNGNIYTGFWKNGKFHGQGTLTKKNRYKYVGEWKFHQEYGYGKKPGLMVILMKEVSKTENSMDKEHIHLMMDGNILVVGKMIKCMEVVNSISLMDGLLKVLTKMDNRGMR